jgi:predicted metal-dependent peptidase
MELYEVFDLKDVIDQYSGSATDLNTWARNDASPEALKAIKKATLSVMDGARIVLANENVFYSAFAMSIHLHVAFDMDAPMAVNTTQDGLLTIQNLYVNPMWLIYKLGNKNNGQFVRTDIYEDVVAIYFHELNHLLYEHPARYRDKMESGYAEIVNIATDTQINQEARIAKNNTLTEYGITVEKVRKNYDLPNLMAGKDSEYYYDELYKKLRQEMEKSKKNRCPECGQQQNQQGQGGQSQQGQGGQNQQGQGNGHDHCSTCGQPMNGQGNGQGQQQTGQGDVSGANGSHQVWSKIPDNTAEGEIADEQAAHESMKNIVKRILDSPDLRSQLSNDKLRGILPGHLYDELIEGKAVKGKLPISAVIRKGTGKLRSGSRRTYTRFNPKQGNRVDLLRGKKELHNKNIHCFIDNSGSMGPTEIEYGVMEVAAVAHSIHANLSIIPFDTVVYYNNKQEVDKQGNFQFIPTGRGGTAFQPVFNYLKEEKANNDNDVIVIITDGYGESRIDNYGLRNVIWILVEESRNTLSVRPQDLRGHEVAWLEEDAKYKLHKLDKEAGL